MGNQFAALLALLDSLSDFTTKPSKRHELLTQSQCVTSHTAESSATTLRKHQISN